MKRKWREKHKEFCRMLTSPHSFDQSHSHRFQFNDIEDCCGIAIIPFSSEQRNANQERGSSASRLSQKSSVAAHFYTQIKVIRLFLLNQSHSTFSNQERGSSASRKLRSFDLFKLGAWPATFQFNSIKSNQIKSNQGRSTFSNVVRASSRYICCPCIERAILSRQKEL